MAVEKIKNLHWNKNPGRNSKIYEKNILKKVLKAKAIINNIN